MSKKTSLIIMFFILGVILMFHVLIFVQIIPYDQVWAGRLNSEEEMKTFETFSILLNVFMLIVLIIKYKQLERGKRNKIVDVLIWLFVALFSLNTLGNLFAENMTELILGTLVTLICTNLCFIIVRKSKMEKP